MELNRFVRVVVERDGAQGGGTGYLLHGDRVLTARHVVEEADRVTVDYVDDLAMEAVRSAPAKVCWEGKGGLDVAVLTIDTSLRIPRQVLGPVVLSDDVPWRSRGWAVAADGSAASGESPVVAAMSALAGIAYQFDEGAGMLELGVDAPPTDADWWKGVSGAPVFCADRLVAVLMSGNRAFAGGRLEAVPISAVWEAEGFRQHVGHDANREELRDQRREELISDLAEILRQNDTAALAIVAKNAAWGEIRRSGGAEALAQAVCTTGSWRELIVALNRAHADMSTRTGTEAAQAANAIARLAMRVVPEVYAATELQIAPGLEGGEWVTLPFETKTMAELAMAAYDGRALAFQPLEARQDYPCGTAALPQADELQTTGFDFGQTEAFRHWLLLVAQWLNLTDEDYRKVQLPERFDELAPLVNLQLEQDVAFGEPRRYFLFSSAFAKKNSLFLAQVHDQLKALRLVPLEGSPSLSEERSDSAPLANILFRSLQKKKEEP